MRVTFLIGNGFDLNLGLHTRYSDFYKYFVEKAPENLIAKSIKGDKDNVLWSDLELGLGKYLENVDENSLDAFLGAKEEMENLLIEYLREEEQRFQISDSKALSADFQKKITNIYTEFDAFNGNLYNQWFHSINGTIDFSFITFNYTDTLDKIVECVSKTYIPFCKHKNGNGAWEDTISMPLHIHGTLDDRGMILGINDISQINNNALRDNADLATYIVKTYLNIALGNGKIDIARKMIDNSNYVCLFGLSIGDTDSYWWSYLIDWLLKDSNRHLVLYVQTKKSPKTAQETVRQQIKHRQNFLKKATMKINKDIENYIMDRIIIVHNSQIFKLEGIRVKFYNSMEDWISSLISQ